MSDHAWHQSLRLQNFTVFKDTKFEFVPGVNALVGENGTGKTHLMKALYAAQLKAARQTPINTILADLFQTTNIEDLIRLETHLDTLAEANGIYNGQKWFFNMRRSDNSWLVSERLLAKAERPVFLPALDMMGHTKGFLAAANEIELDFDLTCRDIVGLFTLRRNNGDRKPVTLEKIQTCSAANCIKTRRRAASSSRRRREFYRCRWFPKGCEKSRRWRGWRKTAG